jgi:hypothetical protein
VPGRRRDPKSTARETPAMMRDNPFHHGNAIPAATEPAEM